VFAAPLAGDVMGEKCGVDLLIEQASIRVGRLIRFAASMSEFKVGDSEIERLFYLALVYQVLLRLQLNFTDLRRMKTDEDHSERLRDADTSILYVTPQAQIGEFRVDFLIQVVDEFETWRSLVVECDGHDFHERTKQQATRDKARDRALVLQGYQVFRFTGSELWFDPMGCSSQVFKWAIAP
jgi:very-short-patch-repair endonuclease